MRTVLINLYGGPGSGKSTVAAALFYFLKRKGYVAEIITEYAKEYAWKGEPITPAVQIDLLEKEFLRIYRRLGKVQYIITDTPLHIAGYYACTMGLMDVTLWYLRRLNNLVMNQIHIPLVRPKAYDSLGRFENEEEAIALDTKQIEFLKATGYSGVIYSRQKIDEQSLLSLVDKILMEEYVDSDY